jgi:TonB-dependent SusC/RagA subfamily outer membrane receptor
MKVGYIYAQSSFIPAQSPITLVYRIDDATAGKYYQGKQKLNEKVLQHCVDTLRDVVTELPGNYPTGHYMLVHSSGNMLQFRLFSVVPFEHRMLNNQRDMALMVMDRETGKIIDNAKVKVGSKRIRYDRETQSYRRKKTDKQGTLTIEADGITAYYTVERKYKINWWKRMKNGLWNVPVVKYVSRPVIFVTSIPMDIYRSFRDSYPKGSIYYIQKPFADISQSISWGQPVGWIDGVARIFDPDKAGNGFFVFSKPRYRPGDTIRFKAFVTNKKDKPVTDSLTASIRTDKYHEIGKLKPYRPGFYTMEFVPKENWGMKLDQRYAIQLANNKVYQSGYFYYEDYELQNVQYHIRSEKTEYLLHEEVTFFAKATDENNMPVMDARVELALISEKVTDFTGKQVLVPDRLWSKEITLDPVGETKIVVPDSIWPAASLNVQLIAMFSNSDNQTAKKDIRFVRKNTPERIFITQKADSLYVHYENYGRFVEGIQVKLNRGQMGDTVLFLPGKVKIHPLADKYVATQIGENRNEALPLVGNPKLFESIVSSSGYQPEPLSVEFIPSADNSGVNCVLKRTRDSIFISVINPLELPLSYTIFKGNKERWRGSGTLTGYKAKASSKDYFLSVQYIWGGREHQLEYRLADDQPQLKLNTSVPAIIYPGQTVKVNILATDAENNPVSGVDLTAWGNTAKFGEFQMPTIPSYQKVFSERRSHNAFSSSEKRNIRRSKKMDYPQWRTPLKLDSVELYRFAYPGKKVYRYELSSSDGKTYIAPYLVHDGKLLPVQILYIDNRPVYFSKSTTNAPYVFPVNPDNHSIRIRTSDCEIYFRVQVYSGCKNIISIDPYEWNKDMEIGKNAVTIGKTVRMKEEYTSNELYSLRNYLMPVRAHINNQFSYLHYGNTYEVLSTDFRTGSNHYYRGLLTGPVAGSDITLWNEEKPVVQFSRDKSFEWFEYEPLPGILKMRTIPFDNNFDKKIPSFDWKRLPYSRQELDSISLRWKQNRLQNKIRAFRTSGYNTNGKFQVETTINDSIQAKAWCWILYNHEWQQARFYPLQERSFDFGNDGIYDLFLLMADKSFYRLDSLQLQTNAANLLRFDIGEMQHPSYSIDSLISHRELLRDIALYSGMDIDIPAKPKANPPVPIKYNPDYKNSIEICGTITDESGEPLPGAIVTVKGTAEGTLSNVDGQYCIRIPEGYRTLTYSFIGYQSVEYTPLESGTGNIVLYEDATALEEVVVVGYGTQKKSKVVGSISTVDALQGKMAGIIVSDKPEQGFFIRGVNTLDGSSQPLYVVDGVVVTDISHLSPDVIADMQMLKGTSAIVLYGARAANGVVVISTKKTGVVDAQDILKQMVEDEAYQAGLASSKGLRNNFSDEAFWQPLLTTDQGGTATFETTFPDDVTKWNLNFIGLVPGKASTTSQVQVRSLKPLMGQVAVPRFMVEGDSANVIGKVINYTSDSVQLHIDFTMNHIIKTEKDITVRHSLIDTLAVVAPEILTVDLPETGDDSISVSYQLTRGDGYQDGELRHIPVIPRGTIEHIGQFHVLDTDTTMTLSFDVSKGPVTLSMESSELDVLLKETRRLRDYKHLCNEQSASRLMALLLERKAYQLSGQDYQYERHIHNLVNRLVKGQNNHGLWGWFGNGDQETWISTHVAGALLQARDDGFGFDFDFSKLTQQLILQYDKSNDSERIGILNMLIRIDPENNYPSLYYDINSNNLLSYTERLRWMELSLHFGIDTDTRSVLENKKTDQLGNIHWTEYDRTRWMMNDVTATLAAYRLLRKAGDNEGIMKKIRNYLLKERDIYYGWRNTYESANILTTIMPDILEDSKGKADKPKITLNGAYHAIIDTFPKHVTITGHEPVTVAKTGTLPVYVAAWQKVFIPEPEAADEGFKITTQFAKETAIDNRTKQMTTSLTAGKVAILEVNVASDVSSEYVLIEIPIPAGCSYQSKPQSWYWRSGETHREYFRDRVCIYLRRLERGTHTFQVELMPRYTGIYYVNPAKVEQMYMPLFYGRTGVKVMNIKD